jgi:putative thiamine transport system substrate-binding protein
MAVANFLLSPEVQFKAATNAKLASEPVLSFENFTPDQQAVLLENARAPGAVSPTELARKIQEPHPSWTNELEREWLRRYGGGR